MDDNSPDGTADAVRELQAQYNDRLFLEQKKTKGLGPAYIHGFIWALQQKVEYIIQMDADFSHRPHALVDFLVAFDKGADVVIGSRYSDGVTVVNWPISRILLSYFASRICSINYSDANQRPYSLSYVAYRTNVLKSVDLANIRYIGYAYQIEMKYKAWKRGFHHQIPIVFKNRIKGHSKMSGQIIWEAFIGVLFLPLQELSEK